MSNMSYCRFENTLSDLRECAENIDDQLEPKGTEDVARARLIKVCFAIVEPFLLVEGQMVDVTLDMDAVHDLPVESDN